MRRRYAAALLIAAAWLAALPAAADEGPAAPVHAGSGPDDRRVGFSPLAGSDLAPEHRYLAETLPELLRERLEGIEGVELVEAAAPVDLLPRQVAAADELNLLIWGEIEAVAGRLVLELHAFDVALVRHVWSYLDSGSADALLAAVDPIADELAGLLLGQPWSRLAVEVTPADSAVRLDGALIGIGATLLRYTAPRHAELSVSRPGYRDAVQRVELAPRQELRIAVELEPLDLGTVMLDSRPGGAAVYVASAYAGVTPLRLPRPAVDTPVALGKEGYADAAARIGPATPATLTITLQPAGYDAAAVQVRGRDLFYEEFGWFAVSILPPLLLSALATDLAYRDAALHSGDGPVVWQPATIGVTIGAVVAAGYSVYRLLRTLGAMIDYTETADRPAG